MSYIFQVNDFSKRVASRRWSGSTIPEEDEDNTSLSAKETAKTAQGEARDLIVILHKRKIERADPTVCLVMSDCMQRSRVVQSQV